MLIKTECKECVCGIELGSWFTCHRRPPTQNSAQPDKADKHPTCGPDEFCFDGEKRKKVAKKAKKKT